MSVKARLADYGGFMDVGILSHGFATHMRDYDVIFEALWGKTKWADAKGTYRLRFTHCPEVMTMTAVSESAWKQAWSDVYVDHSRWVAAGEPDGFVWGACWSTAYPGLSYREDSALARQWPERFGLPMHEATIATEAYRIQIVFHDFTVTKLSDDVRVLDKVMFPLDAKHSDDAG
jgi:hypothetical protein